MSDHFDDLKKSKSIDDGQKEVEKKNHMVAVKCSNLYCNENIYRIQTCTAASSLPHHFLFPHFSHLDMVWPEVTALSPVMSHSNLCCFLSKQAYHW